MPIPDFYNLVLIKVPAAADIPALCKELEAMDEVEYAEPNYIMYPTQLLPVNDPEYPDQIHLEQGSDIDIDAVRAWQINRGSSNIRVGVIDSGIDYHHEDFGNAYGAGAPKVTDGYNYDDNNNNPDDTHSASHGTAMAGMIGALSNNGRGIASIAGGNVASGNNGVQLVALKVGDEMFNVGNVIGALYDGATSVNAGGFGCHVLNYSGGGYDARIAVRRAVSFVVQNDVVFVAAKGNDGTDDYHYPSDFQDNLVMSVGWLGPFGDRDPDSNFGNNMDFAAPIHNTVSTRRNNDYQPGSGTSPAAACVSGIAALMLSQRGDLHRDDVENILEISAGDIVNDPNAPGR